MKREAPRAVRARHRASRASSQNRSEYTGAPLRGKNLTRKPRQHLCRGRATRSKYPAAPTLRRPLSARAPPLLRQGGNLGELLTGIHLAGGIRRITEYNRFRAILERRPQRPGIEVIFRRNKRNVYRLGTRENGIGGVVFVTRREHHDRVSGIAERN